MAGTERAFKSRTLPESLLFFALGAALLGHSLKEHYGGPTVEWKLSPYLFPVMVGVFLVLLSVALFSEGLRELRVPHPDAAPAPATGAGKAVAVTVGMAVGYYLVLPRLHFIPATVIFLAALIFFLGERRLWLLGLVAVVSTLAIWGIFGRALGVLLP
jgi:hypothetical protein